MTEKQARDIKDCWMLTESPVMRCYEGANTLRFCELLTEVQSALLKAERIKQVGKLSKGKKPYDRFPK